MEKEIIDLRELKYQVPNFKGLHWCIQQKKTTM